MTKKSAPPPPPSTVFAKCEEYHAWCAFGKRAYRRNREIASVIDFYDHETSAPRKLMLDAIIRKALKIKPAAGVRGVKRLTKETSPIQPQWMTPKISRARLVRTTA